MSAIIAWYLIVHVSCGITALLIMEIRGHLLNPERDLFECLALGPIALLVSVLRR